MSLSRLLIASSVCIGVAYAAPKPKAKTDLFAVSKFDSALVLKSGGPLWLDLGNTSQLTPLGDIASWNGQGFVLRRKLNAQTFALYSAPPSTDAFENLYTFNTDGIDIQKLLGVRMYRKEGAKAFEDEADIYFDANNFYCSTVNVLYARIDGKWKRFTSSKNTTGSIAFSSAPSQAEVWSEGKNLGLTPFKTPPLASKTHIFELRRPGYMPLPLEVRLQARQQLDVKYDLLPLPAFQGALTPIPTAPLSPDSSHRYMDSLGDAYGQKLRDLLARRDTVNTAFQSLYYAKDTSAQSPEYSRAFDQARKSAFESYGAPVVQALHTLESQLQAIVSARELKRKRNVDIDLKLKDYRISPDSSGKSYHFQADMVSADQWVVAHWEGTIFPDSLTVKALSNALVNTKAPRPTAKTSTPDWPVRLKDSGYRYYRLSPLQLTMNGKVVPSAGLWSFEQAVLDDPEAFAYLKADSLLLEQQRAQAEREALELKAQAELQAGQRRDSIIAQWRGKTVDIKGGELRFHLKTVSISPFVINSTEVTQEHYQRLVGANPSSFSHPQKPVHNINWEDARDFCKLIGGDLPTEAQWEFAVRAGSTSDYYWGNKRVDGKIVPAEPWAIYNANSANLGKRSLDYGPQPVGSRRPNEWGLYDGIGNVREWVKDGHAWWYITPIVGSTDPSGPVTLFTDDHVIKNGGWRSDMDDLKITQHDNEDPRYWANDLGFRCAFAPGAISADSIAPVLRTTEDKALVLAIKKGLVPKPQTAPKPLSETPIAPKADSTTQQEGSAKP